MSCILHRSRQSPLGLRPKKQPIVAMAVLILLSIGLCVIVGVGILLLVEDRIPKGTELLQIPDSRGMLQLSPTGNMMLFQREDESGNRQVWVVDLLNGMERQMTFGRPHGRPCWSPDGEWIAYVRGRCDEIEDKGLYMTPLKGSSETLLREGVVGGPNWGAGGIAYMAYSATEGWSLCVVDVGEHSWRDPGSGYVIDRGTLWSPDGRWLLGCKEDCNGVRQIVKTNVEDGEIVYMTTQVESNRINYRCWSPDGRWIAYVRTSGKRNSLCVTPVDGGVGDVVVLTVPLREYFLDIAWTPCSTSIVYIKNVRGNHLVYRIGIHEKLPTVLGLGDSGIWCKADGGIVVSRWLRGKVQICLLSADVGNRRSAVRHEIGLRVGRMWDCFLYIVRRVKERIIRLWIE